MISKIPFDRVNWGTSSFLILSFVASLIGVPIYIYHYGIDFFQIALFLIFFFLSGMSITLGYHRLFAHKAFKASAPVRFFTLVFGACAFEDSALDWSSDHRQHHKHVDHEEDDPYSITKGFFWAHMGWIFFKLFPRTLPNVNDLRTDKLVMWQHKYPHLIGVLMGFVFPAFLGYLWGGWSAALGAFLIAGLARVVCVQHCTFFINSLCHTIGNRPYDSSTSARDSWLMAIFTFGEGYHNYHHSFQHDYRNGVKGWQWDPTKWAIWSLEKLGLASDLRRVSREKIVLAELRETRKVAHKSLEELRENSSSYPEGQDTQKQLSSLYDQLGESYTELEEAVSKKLEVSREALDRWQKDASEILALITRLNKLSPSLA